MFYDYFAECEIRVKWASANSLAQSVTPSVCKLLFECIFADQCTTWLDEEKNILEWFVKHSEGMSNEIITAMSITCGASIFSFELV